MIKGISSTGRYISVSGGNTSGPYISPGSAGAGMVRWNPNMSQLEINDGNSWLSLSTSYASISLTDDAIRLLDWANKKMDEEEAMLSLPNDHPAIKIAKQNVNRAKQALKEAEEQLKITSILSEEQ
jgi:protein subunit release factor A